MTFTAFDVFVDLMEARIPVGIGIFGFFGGGKVGRGKGLEGRMLQTHSQEDEESPFGWELEARYM